MGKNSNSNRSIKIALVGTAVATTLLWLLVAHSVSISFINRGGRVIFMLLAYGLLSLWTVLSMSDGSLKNLLNLSRRDRLWGAAGLVIGPLLLTNVLFLLFPLIGSGIASEVAIKKFTYVSSEPYARASRGLVQLKLIDDRGGEHAVVFKKERVDRLGMKCGDILATKGRDSFLGYVIDSEATTDDASKPCSKD